MKLTVKLFMAALVIAGLTLVKPVTAAPMTWTGTISDAMCKGAHGDKGGTEQKDHDCSVTCAKSGGYVFVTQDKDKKTLVTVPGSGGLSPAMNALEGEYAFSWAKNIWADMLT